MTRYPATDPTANGIRQPRSTLLITQLHITDLPSLGTSGFILGIEKISAVGQYKVSCWEVFKVILH